MNSVNNLFSKKYIKSYETKIKHIGPNNKMNASMFLLTRILITIILLVGLLLIPNYGLLLAVIICPLFYILYTKTLLDFKIEKRKKELYSESIIFYEMLKLSYNKTKDLKVSLDIVSIKLGNSLSIEFQKVLKNNRYNNDLKEVLTKVIETIPNDDVKKGLIDLKEGSDYNKIMDNNIRLLQEKNAAIIKSDYQFKPIILVFGCIVILTIICILLFNLNNLLDYFTNLFK